MAGLQSFVRGNQPSQTAQPTRSDRLLYATNAKVSARTSAVHATSTPQLAQGTSYPSWNTPNPALSRDAYRSAWHSAGPHPAPTPQKGIFDDTLSGLDETESVMSDGRREAGPGGNILAREDDDYDEVETIGEDIEHRPDRPTTPRGGGISGRFYQPPPSQKPHANMELRPYHIGAPSEQQLNSSKKRNRIAEDTRLHADAGHGGPVIPGNFDASSSGEDSLSDGQSGKRTGGSGPGGADYDDKQLSGMAYQQLKDETWESETHGAGSTVPLALHDPSLPLRSRFENCLGLDAERAETPDVQVEFFAKLPAAEWEEAGDLFVERFADLMRQLREARRAKRAIARDFERMVDEREEAIRERGVRIDGALADMKKGGEGVIRGKLI